MKKLLSIFLFMLINFNLCNITNSSHKTYEMKDQVTITSKEEFLQFAKDVNEGLQYQNANVNLACDITIELEDNWIPIGTYEHPFLGKFKGNYHKIILNANLNSDNVGLFGYSVDSTFENLIVEGTINGQNNVAAFVGYGENLSFQNCYATNLCSVTGKDCVGLFIGCGDGHFNYCGCYSTVEGSQYLGSFVGLSTEKSYFSFCSNYAKSPKGPLNFCSNDLI